MACHNFISASRRALARINRLRCSEWPCNNPAATWAPRYPVEPVMKVAMICLNLHPELVAAAGLPAGRRQAQPLAPQPALAVLQPTSQASQTLNVLVT